MDMTARQKELYKVRLPRSEVLPSQQEAATPHHDITGDSNAGSDGVEESLVTRMKRRQRKVRSYPGYETGEKNKKQKMSNKTEAGKVNKSGK